ncbi:MAG: NTP pyrophosphohydrolase, partial [Alistipes sp.]|nr:NTP pyrophosphohydrolase [Alistipes sp.]
ITDFVPEKMCHYLYDSVRERELVFVHRATYDGEVHPSEETDGGRFWSIEEIRQKLGNGIFTPNFEMEAVKVGLI